MTVGMGWEIHATELWLKSVDIKGNKNMDLSAHSKYRRALFLYLWNGFMHHNSGVSSPLCSVHRLSSQEYHFCISAKSAV